MKNWNEQLILPAKDPDIDYAYILGFDEEPIICDKETLLEVIESESKVKFVTSPQHDGFIIPGTDSETLLPFLRKEKKEKKDIKYLLYGGIFFIVLFIGFEMSIFLDSENESYRFPEYLIFLINGLMCFIAIVYKLIQSILINKGNSSRIINKIKFQYWYSQEKVIPIYIVTGILILLNLYQFRTGVEESFSLVGFVDSKIFEGEYWRLLTSTLIHSNDLETLANGIIIFIIGRLVIRLTSFSHFAFVFLFSALLGSILSLYLSPTATYIGATGGLLGLIGFIIIVFIKFKDNIPRYIIALLLGLIVIIMILDAHFFNEAAHASGLIGGILLGLLLIRNNKNIIPYKASLTINILGIASTIILIGGIGIIMWLL